MMVKPAPIAAPKEVVEVAKKLKKVKKEEKDRLAQWPPVVQTKYPG